MNHHGFKIKTNDINSYLVYIIYKKCTKSQLKPMVTKKKLFSKSFLKQRCVHRSKTCCQTVKHFDNVFATGRNNIVEVLESLNDGYAVV